MLPRGHETAIDRLKRIIDDKEPNLTELAEKARVRYVPLYKFATGRQKSYNLLEGERVYYALTGKTFLP
jgi:predicted transcriptional regulator